MLFGEKKKNPPNLGNKTRADFSNDILRADGIMYINNVGQSLRTVNYRAGHAQISTLRVEVSPE